MMIPPESNNPRRPSARADRPPALPRFELMTLADARRLIEQSWDDARRGSRTNFLIAARCVLTELLALETELDAQTKLAESYAYPRKPRPLDDWHEDDGPCLWWKLPVEEPPYVGTPLDHGFPDYVTHWTRLPLPIGPGVEP